MTFLIPTPEQAHFGLRSIKTVLLSGGYLTDAHREAIAAIQKHLLHTDYDIDSLAPITPDDLSSVVTDRALREQLVNSLVTFAMLSDHVDPRQADAVEAFAAALDVAPAAVRQLRHLAEERFMLLRFDVVRHGPASNGFRQIYEDGGAFGVVRNILGFAGLIENKDIADKYWRLAGYPQGTLGKELYDFYTARNFKFPGEKGGAPEGLLPHDLTHVLGGYDTDLNSEGRVLAFTAGYRRQEMFGILIFILVQAQHGVKLTPLAEAVKGRFSAPGMVTGMVEAFARGCKVNTDLMDRWNFWAVMDRPVAELRRRYGIEAQA
jgi:hypothetical protein